MKSTLPLEKIVSKIAALGVPGLVFVVAVGATGLSGAAAITAALAALGPGGIVGGIAFLGVAGVIAAGITEYGTEAILKGVIQQLYLRGESKESIKAKIEKYPISKSLKYKLFEKLDSFKI